MSDLPPKKPATRGRRSKLAPPKPEKAIWELRSEELYADPNGFAGTPFLDDLSAAIRFKSFLVGIGAGVPEDVTKGLGTLTTAFSGDIQQYENEFRSIALRPWWWQRLWRKFFFRRYGG